jgi:hypothetical protein
VESRTILNLHSTHYIGEYYPQFVVNRQFIANPQFIVNSRFVVNRLAPFNQIGNRDDTCHRTMGMSPLELRCTSSYPQFVVNRKSPIHREFSGQENPICRQSSIVNLQFSLTMQIQSFHLKGTHDENYTLTANIPDALSARGRTKSKRTR